MIDFIMPESKRDEGENPIVDSLAISSNWTIVSKCALHGLIYVWDLKETLREPAPEKEDPPMPRLTRPLPPPTPSDFSIVSMMTLGP